MVVDQIRKSHEVILQGPHHSISQQVRDKIKITFPLDSLQSEFEKEYRQVDLSLARRMNNYF